MEVIQSRNAVQIAHGTWRDYFQLTKPLTTAMLQVPSLAALFAAAGQSGPAVGALIALVVGGILASAGANALNSWVDTETDSLMYHTRRRPLPSQRIDPQSARRFGLVLCALGSGTIALGTNLLAGLLTLAGILIYVLVYTSWLKMRTMHNTLFSGVAWAFPVLVGWAASGSLSPQAFILFGIILYWAPVMYLTRGIAYKRDFTRAAVPLLPVLRGDRPARSQVLLFSILTILMSFGPVVTGFAFSYYGVAAMSLGGLLLLFALFVNATPGPKPARDLSRYAQFYLVMLFTALLLDRIAFISR